MPSGLLLKIGIGGAIMLALFIWHQVDRNAAYADGQRNERLIWQERQARAEIEADKARKAAQAEISRIESNYWQRAASDALRLKELEEELARETHADDPARADGCPALVGKGLRDKLNAIGRD